MTTTMTTSATVETTEQLIKYTAGCGIGCINRVSKLSKFEAYCKLQKDAFEKILDDEPIKPYFDVDYKIKDGEITDQNDRVDKGFRFLLKILQYLSEYYVSKINVYPKYCVATSHKDTKYSFHINILNINTIKKSMNQVVEDLNKMVKEEEARTDEQFMYMRVKEILQLGDDNLFDHRPYSSGMQKMRCVHCCKDDEPSRPVKLFPKALFETMYATHPNFSFFDFSTSEVFEDMLISVTDPDNEVYAPEVIKQPKPAPKPKPAAKTGDTADTSADEMLVNMAIDRGLLTGFSKDYGDWIRVGWVLKNTFDDAKGWELFDRFCRLAGTKYNDLQYLENWDVWDSWKSKDQVENPIGMGSLIKMLEKDHKKELKEIQKECRSFQRTQVQNAEKTQKNNQKESQKTQKYEEKESKKIQKDQEKAELERAFLEMAAEFEKTHCKIINKSIYINEQPNTVILMSKSKIEEAYEHMSVGSSDKGVPTLFIKKWMKSNDNIRKYDDMDIYPNTASCPKNIYNMW